MCNDESFNKYWVLFCFARDFENVVMEEDLGHGGMNIIC
jgi:hypothetical protein